MHKMKVTFQQDVARKSGVTPEMIAEEVEDLGFEATYLNTYEVLLEDGSSVKNNF